MNIILYVLKNFLVKFYFTVIYMSKDNIESTLEKYIIYFKFSKLNLQIVNSGNHLI